MQYRWLCVQKHINDNSDVSIFASTLGMCQNQYFPIAVKELQGGQEGKLYSQDMPALFMGNYVVPLYIGRRFEMRKK